MKRLFQGIALLQIFLVVALSMRVVSVWRTPLPEVGEIPDLPALSSVPPPKLAPKIPGTVTDDVVEHDLFDEERGQGEVIDVSAVAIDEAPVPPPSSVKLTGVMLVGDEPVGILLDTSVKPEQQSVRKGEMFGEYEVGDITKSGLLLLGGGGQQFQIPLRVEAVAALPPAAAAPPPAPGTPAPPPSRPAPATRPVAGGPATARPAREPKPEGIAAAVAEEAAKGARERNQAIAQRSAELSKLDQRGTPGAGAADQARLEALRQLRAAAKSR